jgi:hypothetical protein
MSVRFCTTRWRSSPCAAHASRNRASEKGDRERSRSSKLESERLEARARARWPVFAVVSCPACGSASKALPESFTCASELPGSAAATYRASGAPSAHPLRLNRRSARDPANERRTAVPRPRRGRARRRPARCEAAGALALALSLAGGALAFLALNNCGIGHGELGALRAALSRPGAALRELELDDNLEGPLFHIGLASALQSSSGLTSLSAARCRLGAHGLELLAESVAGHARLAALDLAGNARARGASSPARPASAAGGLEQPLGPHRSAGCPAWRACSGSRPARGSRRARPRRTHKRAA